jgi:uncharacterized protein YkwD
MRWAILLALALEPPSLQDEMLSLHNAVRSTVGLPPLAWSGKLEQAAQEWADLLVKDGSFRHRPHSPFGENLFAVTGMEYLPRQVVFGWTSEAKDFDYPANRCKPDRACGHYTQIVWRNTREVGCAVARGGSREVWVCEYAPPGNYSGMRPY